jgi:mRNA-degrading endonuclease toxin of MazEF toxin-antitoxin module
MEAETSVHASTRCKVAIQLTDEQWADVRQGTERPIVVQAPSQAATFGPRPTSRVMKVSRGDIVLVDYPFTDRKGSKVRSALVVQTDSLNA